MYYCCWGFWYYYLPLLYHILCTITTGHNNTLDTVSATTMATIDATATTTVLPSQLLLHFFYHHWYWCSILCFYLYTQTSYSHIHFSTKILSPTFFLNCCMTGTWLSTIFAVKCFTNYMERAIWTSAMWTVKIMECAAWQYHLVTLCAVWSHKVWQFPFPLCQSMWYIRPQPHLHFYLHLHTQTSPFLSGSLCHFHLPPFTLTTCRDSQVYPGGRFCWPKSWCCPWTQQWCWHHHWGHCRGGTIGRNARSRTKAIGPVSWAIPIDHEGPPWRFALC